MSSATLEQGGAPRAANPSGDLALFHRALSELCRAEVPLSKALQLLQADLRERSLRRAVGEMAREVEAGMPLAEAYERRRECFPELYRALVEAGLEAGDLPGVLDEISRHAHAKGLVAERMRKALTYPLVAAMFVIALGVGLIAFVGPQLKEALSNAAMSSSAVAAPDVMPVWVTATGGVAILALAIMSVVCLAWLRSPLDYGSALRGIGYRFPLLGRLRLNAAKASFAATISLLARRNLPLPKALKLAAAATDDKCVRECIDRMAARASDGASLTEAVRAGDLISPSLLWLVEASESSGTAADALADVAAIYHQRLDRSVERLCTLATPIAELLLGLVVLGFAVSYMLPAVQFADKVYGF